MAWPTEKSGFHEQQEPSDRQTAVKMAMIWACIAPMGILKHRLVSANF